MKPLAFIALPATTGESRPRLALRSPYDRDMVERLKEVMPRGKWHAEKAIWHWPLTMASCRKLRQVYGADLTIQTQLNFWYAQEKEEQARREKERQLALAQAAREAEERARLAEERALYGQVSYSVNPFDQLGGGGPLQLPAEWLDIDRTPVQECSGIDTSLIRMPEPSARLDLQLAGARWLVENGGGVLADEVGLGKSLTVLMAVLGSELAAPGPHLIVAPLKVARATWPVEIRKWTTEGAVVAPDWHPGQSGAGFRDVRARSVAQCERAAAGHGDRPHILVVNHDALVQYGDWLAGVRWASVVVDEADQVLSVGHVGGGSGTKRARGLMKLRVHPDGLRVALTGTPFRGRLANAWGLIDFCRPGAVGTSRKDFASVLTQKVAEEGGGATLDRVRTGREREWSHLMQGWFLRRTRTAAQRAMIVKREEIVEPLPEQREQDQMWRQRELWAGPHVENDLYERVDVEGGRSFMQSKATGEAIPDVIVAVGRRLQLSVGQIIGGEDGGKINYAGPSPKVDRLIELLSEWGLLEDEWWWMAGEHGKVIIASPWTSGLDLVEKRLLHAGVHASGILRIDGSTTARGLEKVVAEFTAPRGPGILLLSSKAGGAGLTLDQHCTRMVILSEDWIEDTQAQVIGRISNRTWETHREIVVLRAAGMLDEYLGRRTAHQRATAGAMMELARAGGDS